MSRALFVLFSLCLLGTATLTLIPTASVQAGIIPCGLSTPDPEIPGGGTERCTLCHLIVGINRIIVSLRNIMAAVAIAILVAMAVIYITSGGNESRMTYAKGGMLAALIGLGIILLAWVTVNFILTLPVISTTTGLIRTGWDTLECSGASYSTGAVATPTPTPGTGSGGSGGGGGAGGTGTVTLPRDTSGAIIIAPIASPAGVTAAPIPTGITLSWTPLPGATGYELERCTGLTCTTFGSIGTSNTPSFTDTGLTPGTGYSYHIRAITPAGVSTWSNVVGATVPVGTGATGTGALCPDPGSAQFLLGKSWVSDFTQSNGLPVHWEVSVNASNQLTFRVLCRMSAIGWGADLSPQITVPIGSLTGSTFQVLSPGTQRLTNTQGNYCEVSLAGAQTYTPLSVSSLRFQGQTFVTGACQGGGSPGGGSGDPGGGGGGNPAATVRIPGSCRIGSYVPNVSIGTGLNGSLTSGQYGGAVGTGSVGYPGPQVIYVNVPAGQLVAIPYVQAPGGNTWVDLASFGGSSIVGQRAQISISAAPGGLAEPNCVSQLGVFQPRILTDPAHCNVPSRGYINVATTGSCAGGSVTCIFMVRQTGGVVMTGAGTGGACSSASTSPPSSTSPPPTTTVPPASTTLPPFPWIIQGRTFTSLTAVQSAFSPSCVNIGSVRVVSGFGPCVSGTSGSGTISSTPPPFPWTIQGQTFTSLSAAQAAFPNMGIVINGVVVYTGVVIGNVFGTSP